MTEMFVKTPHFDFIGFRRIAFAVSGVITLLTVGSIAVHRGFNMGIDFVGGTVVQYRFEKPVQSEIGRIRSIVNTLNLGQIEVKTVGGTEGNEVQLSVQKHAQGLDVGARIRKALKSGLADIPFELRQEENVGPRIGAEMSMKAAAAVGLSLVAIIIYMWFRFDIAYGLGGVIALFHDVLVTLGFFSVTTKEISISIVAALLTIVGYSINDTIVIFDRVREKLGGKLHGTAQLPAIINTSINETLSRTIITSGTVLFVLVAFSFFAGQVIRDFALAMLVGCISGIYSTVYIASPIVIWWNGRFGAAKPARQAARETGTPREQFGGGTL